MTTNKLKLSYIYTLIKRSGMKNEAIAKDMRISRTWFLGLFKHQYMTRDRAIELCTALEKHIKRVQKVIIEIQTVFIDEQHEKKK